MPSQSSTHYWSAEFPQSLSHGSPLLQQELRVAARTAQRPEEHDDQGLDGGENAKEDGVALVRTVRLGALPMGLLLRHHFSDEKGGGVC